MPEHDHRPTSRVVEILESLASLPEGLTLTEIAVAVNAPKSSIFPFVHTLQRRNFIECEKSTGKYRLALGAFALASGYLETHSLYRLVMAEMRQIVGECSEVCQLGVLRGGDVLYIGKVDSPEAIRLVSHVGKRLPASCTGIGKALLSGYDEEKLHELYGDALPVLSLASVTSFSELAAQLEAIRNGEPAVDLGEAHEHIRCLALPLYFNGRVDSAVSVSTPHFRFTKEKKKCVLASLYRAKAAIEKHMADLGEGLAGREEDSL